MQYDTKNNTIAWVFISNIRMLNHSFKRNAAIGRLNPLDKSLNKEYCNKIGIMSRLAHFGSIYDQLSLASSRCLYVYRYFSSFTYQIGVDYLEKFSDHMLNNGTRKQHDIKHSRVACFNSEFQVYTYTIDDMIKNNQVVPSTSKESLSNTVLFMSK
ncbi:hypothetical protein K501DRAFT_280335 [Backusella circina FSU 941]|nr:hypothetical protein K501DRAFT_280335 [Backusella circina FSU 941]